MAIVSALRFSDKDHKSGCPFNLLLLNGREKKPLLGIDHNQLGK